MSIQILVLNGGDDLTLSILKLMNNVKKQQQFPECLEPCNITSLLKNKSKKEDRTITGVYSEL